MRFIVVILSLLSFPAHAGEITALENWLNSLPAMNSQDRAAFDKAARSMYDPQCNCLSFIHDGIVRKAVLPITDKERHLLVEGIKRNLIIPMIPDRSS